MRAGHLYLQTNTNDPGVIRARTQDAVPPGGDVGEGARNIWVGHYRDVDTGLMHLHNVLRRHLVDIDDHTYRVGLAQAIAAVETEPLSHQRVYLDTDLDPQTQADTQRWETYYRRRQQRVSLVIRWISYLAVGYLLIILVFGF